MSRRVLVIIALLAFGVATTALPVLAFRYPLTQDGGAHYNTAMALAGLETGSPAFFASIYEPRATPPSNQMASRLMAWAAEWGAAASAERMVWLAVFIALVGVMVGNLCRLTSHVATFSLLSFPVFAGTLVNLGFLNYLFGLALFAQSVFSLQAHQSRPTRRGVAGLALLAVATYLAHPIAALALAATSGAFTAGYLLRWLVTRRLRRDPAFSLLVPTAGALVALLPVALAVQEAFAQIVRFFQATAISVVPGTASLEPGADTLRERIIDLAGLGFISYAPADYLFAAGFALLLLWLGARWAIARWRSRAWRPHDDWLASIATLLALAVIVPRDFEYYLPERLVACLLTVVIIWLASSPLDRFSGRVLLAAGLLLNAGLLVWRLQWSASIERILTEYATVAPAIPENATVLALRTPPSHLQRYCRALRPRELPCNFRPTLHFMGELIGTRALALLSNYQLRQEAGFFPVSLRAPWREYARFTFVFERWTPDPLTLGRTEIYALVDQTPPDVIVTWDEALATGAPNGLFPAAAQDLLRHYRPVFTSRPLGAAVVYVRASP